MSRKLLNEDTHEQINCVDLKKRVEHETFMAMSDVDTFENSSPKGRIRMASVDDQ